MDGIPNIIIGIGLALTFLLLAIVLGNAGGALSSNNSLAIQDLLNNASSKFWISVAALLCSIGFSLFVKWSYNKLQYQLDHLTDLLSNNHLSHFGAEQTIIQQLQLMQSIATDSHHTATQTNWHQAKFFEAVAASIEQAVTPILTFNATQTHSVLAEVRDAVINLSESNAENIIALGRQMKEINQKAIRQMVDDFRHSLTAASSTEMQLFQQTIKDLSQQLEQACQQLVVALPAAAQSCTKTLQQYTSAWADQLQQSTGQNIESLNTASDQIEQNLQQVRASSAYMTETFAALAEVSKLSLQNMKATQKTAQVTEQSLVQMSTKLEPVFERVQEALSELSQIIQPASQLMIGAFDDASNGIAEVGTQLQSIVSAVTKLSQKLSGLDALNDSVAQLKEEQYDFLASHLNRMDEQTVLLKKILSDFQNVSTVHQAGQNRAVIEKITLKKSIESQEMSNGGAI